MYDELTQVDIDKMQAEIDERMSVLRPKIMEEVRTARAFGDLSENYEYKAAKQEMRKNESRIRYLKRMVATAKVIPASETPEGEVGLFSWVTLQYEEDGEQEEIQLVTTLRQNAQKGLISKESPLGRALMGRHVGERVRVEVEGQAGYWVVVSALRPGEDDASLPISRY